MQEAVAADPRVKQQLAPSCSSSSSWVSCVLCDRVSKEGAFNLTGTLQHDRRAWLPCGCGGPALRSAGTTSCSRRLRPRRFRLRHPASSSHRLPYTAARPPAADARVLLAASGTRMRCLRAGQLRGLFMATTAPGADVCTRGRTRAGVVATRAFLACYIGAISVVRCGRVWGTPGCRPRIMKACTKKRCGPPHDCTYGWQAQRGHTL